LGLGICGVKAHVGIPSSSCALTILFIISVDFVWKNSCSPPYLARAHLQFLLFFILLSKSNDVCLHYSFILLIFIIIFSLDVYYFVKQKKKYHLSVEDYLMSQNCHMDACVYSHECEHVGKGEEVKCDKQRH
jgi:hypothetical protein